MNVSPYLHGKDNNKVLWEFRISSHNLLSTYHLPSAVLAFPYFKPLEPLTVYL